LILLGSGLHLYINLFLNLHLKVLTIYYGPVLNNRLCSHQSYVIEEEGKGTNLVYCRRYVRSRLDVRVQNERGKECRRWAVWKVPVDCRGNSDGVTYCPNQTPAYSRNLYYLLSLNHCRQLSSLPTTLIERLGCRSKHSLLSLLTTGVVDTRCC
jgi:hypothetical protein